MAGQEGRDRLGEVVDLDRREALEVQLRVARLDRPEHLGVQRPGVGGRSTS